MQGGHHFLQRSFFFVHHAVLSLKLLFLIRKKLAKFVHIHPFHCQEVSQVGTNPVNGKFRKKLFVLCKFLTVIWLRVSPQSVKCGFILFTLYLLGVYKLKNSHVFRCIIPSFMNTMSSITRIFIFLRNSSSVIVVKRLGGHLTSSFGMTFRREVI